MTTEAKLSTRQRNLLTMLNLLQQDSSQSAKDLSTQTGLSIVSINKLLDVLDNKQLITNGFLNTPGRRAKTYQLRADAGKLGIIQLIENNGKIQITYFLCDLLGQVYLRKEAAKSLDSLDYLLDFIKNMAAKDQPDKIIVGIPGVELNALLQISDVQSLQGINLSAAITTATGIDSSIVNDVNASTYGANEKSSSENITVGIYFPKSFGPGVGIVINNHLLHGADGLTGEIQFGTVSSENKTQEIIQHLQNIISLLNPNLVIAYVEKLNLSDTEISHIKQTIDRKLPLHQNYSLNFDHNFENDYLTGLIAIGRRQFLRERVLN
ncbi:ROK family protein [Companilactobacillus pabuli]|uniref:ROK family protein n=1 Tax=Companilactobacillus pabuli TaxID=2714036 RepID=A0A7L7KV39_9LACO|nr:ROK family protein [Companilactobacillus pabuli]AKP02201.1 hypothetical protein ABB45_00260 [Companilactobacillus farciminis]AKS50498.1 hypothetical protein ABB44_00260 [Companilactobacillus farciminis]MDG5113583.1 ROK family protein [Companilactobacillus pabuli]QMT83691.1 ROK family protein [Companilactobacillus pabuli]GAQ02546.1 Rok family transcriptional repressor [Companilactobacillus farciminis]